MSEKDSKVAIKCKETINRIVEELKARYPERKEILYADITDYIMGYKEVVKEEMEGKQDEILDILTKKELSYIMTFCNLRMGDIISH